MPVNAEDLHDRDWLETKASDDFYADSPRYPDIVDVVTQTSPRELLDIGCGSGYLAKLLKTRLPGLSVDGIDISAAALERAKDHLGQWWQCNIDEVDLPVESNRYDTAVCVEVIEHLYDPDHALREIYRILRPDGCAVITVPNLAFWRFRVDLFRGRVPLPALDRRHLHQFNQPIFERTLADAGFQVLATTGHSVRIPRLAQKRPELFSDILIAHVKK